MTTYAAPSVGATSSTRQLLGAGIIAGPVFAVTAAAQVLTRDGFDLRKHPLSLLSNGDYGWVQIANFIVSGAMLIAFAVGVHRVLLDGRGSTWGPRHPARSRCRHRVHRAADREFRLCASRFCRRSASMGVGQHRRRHRRLRSPQPRSGLEHSPCGHLRHRIRLGGGPGCAVASRVTPVHPARFASADRALSRVRLFTHSACRHSPV